MSAEQEAKINPDCSCVSVRLQDKVVVTRLELIRRKIIEKSRVKRSEISSATKMRRKDRDEKRFQEERQKKKKSRKES